MGQNLITTMCAAAVTAAAVAAAQSHTRRLDCDTHSVLQKREAFHDSFPYCNYFS